MRFETLLTILVVHSMSLDDHDTYVCNGYRDPHKFRWVGYSLADLDSNGHIHCHQSVSTDVPVGEEMGMKKTDGLVEDDNQLSHVDSQVEEAEFTNGTGSLTRDTIQQDPSSQFLDTMGLPELEPITELEPKLVLELERLDNEFNLEPISELEPYQSYTLRVL